MMTFIRRVLPYFILASLCIFLYSLSRQTREDIKVEYGHHKMHEPFVVYLEDYEMRYICYECDMMVKSNQNSAQVVTKSGKVYIFDDVGCMVTWLIREKIKEEDHQAYVYSKDTKAYIPAEYAWFVRTGLTPVGYGFEAFETSIEARRNAYMSSEIESQIGVFQRKQESSDIYEYDEIKLFIQRGETLLHPMIKNELLERM